MPHYQKVRFMADLKMGVERAKVELSSATVARIFAATPLLDELGVAVTVEVEITREQFEAMIMPLVERSIKICHEALRLSEEYPPDMVDVVLLVGGSSQIPLVQRKVRQAFGADKVVVHPRPMYAVAEGAAIVAAGKTDKVTTVSRDYFIKLESDPRFKVISRGDILPITTAHTFKTIADGQRLIHFEFFSPDDVKEALDGVKGDERIGEMWLGLDQYYPQGTEVMVNLELDEKNSDLKITATLKNDLSVRVSCIFSRGRSDERINKELEQTIEDLNAQDLTDFGVKEALKLAVPVVQATNQIIDAKTGEERTDMRARAEANLKKLQVSMSKQRSEAEYLANECERLVELCGSLIPQQQQDRLQKLKNQLEAAIESNNESAMQSLCEDAKQEIRNLPDEVKMIGACFVAISNAKAVAPTQSSAMADKVFRMISALERKDGREADRLWSDLQPDVSHWLAGDQLPSSKSIVTGLTR
jgi:molecular chaperone DnaK